jgi:hypothetical protein
MNELERTAGGNFSATTAIPFISSHNGSAPAAVTVTETPNATITLTGRGGVGQAVRVRMAAVNNDQLNGALGREGWSYRIEYSGTFSVNNAVPRLRLEDGGNNLPNGTNIHDGPAAVDGAFSHSITFTRAQVAAIPAAGTLSLSSSNANTDITYTDIRIIAVPPAN